MSYATRIATTCLYNGLRFDVEFEHEPEIKGGLEEAPQSECLDIVSVRYEGADFYEMLNDSVFESFERQIRGQE